jgi:fucose permease
MTTLQTTTITAALVFGMCLALLGSLKLALAKRLNLGEGRIGFLLSALNGAIIPLMLVAGLLIDALGAKAILILGSLTTALAVASLGLRPSYGRAFGSLLLAGLGSACLGAAAVVLMPRAFFGMDQMASASLNLGCVFIALGALVTPVLSDVLVRLLEFRRTAGVLAVLCLAPALAAAMTPAEQLHVGAQAPDLFALLTEGNLWLIGLVFFFYAPLEGSVNVWATTYLTDLGQGERGAAWVLSAFWGAFLASRLLTAMVLHWAAAPWLEPWLIIVVGMLAAAVVGNMIGTGHRSAARLSLVLLGFLLGPIFPTLVGLAFRIAPAAPGTAYGAVFALGSVGGLVMAPLVGARARQAGVQSALYIPMMLALALTAAALVFALTGERV